MLRFFALSLSLSLSLSLFLSLALSFFLSPCLFLSFFLSLSLSFFLSDPRLTKPKRKGSHHYLQISYLSISMSRQPGCLFFLSLFLCLFLSFFLCTCTRLHRRHRFHSAPAWISLLVNSLLLPPPPFQADHFESIQSDQEASTTLSYMHLLLPPHRNHLSMPWYWALIGNRVAENSRSDSHRQINRRDKLTRNTQSSVIMGHFMSSISCDFGPSYHFNPVAWFKLSQLNGAWQ